MEDVIINLSPVFKRLEEKEHYRNVFGGQFSMAMKRFVLNIILLNNNLQQMRLL